MRSGLLAIILAWCAGCGPAGGLQFEIDASRDPAASQVWIYVGKGGGIDASIAAELQTPGTLHDGRFWPLAFDSVEIFDLSATDRTTTISFVPGDKVEKLTVVAVGLTSGHPTSVATKTLASVRSDVVEVWELVLEPAAATVDSATGKAVMTWGDAPGETTCVQAVDRGAPLENVFIGLPGDKDCDGFHDGKPEECDDTWHRASTTPSLQTLSCLGDQSIQDPTGGPIEACMFGAPLCIDGKPGERSDCSHLRPYCAPNGLCESCSSDSPVDRFNCALGLDPIQNAAVSYVKCDIEVNVTESPPRLCDQRMFAALPSGWLGSNPSPSCAIRPPMFHSSDPGTSWSTTTVIGAIALQFGIPLPGNPTCGIDIVPMQLTGTPLDNSAFPRHGLIALELDIGTGVVTPITFNYKQVSSCDVGATRFCTPVPTSVTETISSCIRSAPIPGP